MKATVCPVSVDTTKLPAMGPLPCVPLEALMLVALLAGDAVVAEDSVELLVEPVPVLLASEALLSVAEPAVELVPLRLLFAWVKEPDHCMPASVD
jgi:hypothetical protein